MALNPYGVTRGTILSCIVFIFLTWAVTPDVFYGTTYYFYLSPENAYVDLLRYAINRTIRSCDCTLYFCPSAFAGACLSQLRPKIPCASAKVQTARHPLSPVRNF